MQQIIETVAGDSAPDRIFNVSRADGSIVNLTGATVTLRIKDPLTGQRTNDSANTCLLIDPANGVCKYVWNAGGTDCPDPGIYPAALRIVYGNGKKETYKLRIEASEDV